MTDHSSSADGAGEGWPSQQPAPPQLSAEAARSQVAAAWVRVAPQSNVPPGQVAVPSLPPRADRPAAESKKDKREQAKAERKAEYERKRAARKAEYESKQAARASRKGGGKVSASTTSAATTASAEATAPTAGADPSAAEGAPRPRGAASRGRTPGSTCRAPEAGSPRTAGARTSSCARPC